MNEQGKKYLDEIEDEGLRETIGAAMECFIRDRTLILNPHKISSINAINSRIKDLLQDEDYKTELFQFIQTEHLALVYFLHSFDINTESLIDLLEFIKDDVLNISLMPALDDQIRISFDISDAFIEL